MTPIPFTRRKDIPPALLQPPRMESLLRAACTDWAVIIGCWAAMYAGPHALWPLWMLLVAGRLHALGVVLHDACHLKRAPPTAASRLLELLAGYPITSTLPAMRYHHLRHHRHSGMALDPYFKPGASHRFWPALLGRLRGPVMVLAWFVRGFFGSAALAWPRLRNAYGRIFFGERSDADLTRHAEIERCLRAEPAQALFFLALVPVALLLPQAVLFGYLLPLMLAGLFNANRVVAEHLHVRTTDREPATLVATTRTHDWGLAGRLFLYPRNIGFHLAHHLHPTVAMQNLPALDAWYRENEPGYRAAPAIESMLPPRPRAATTGGDRRH